MHDHWNKKHKLSLG